MDQQIAASKSGRAEATSKKRFAGSRVVVLRVGAVRRWRGRPASDGWPRATGRRRALAAAAHFGTSMKACPKSIFDAARLAPEFPASMARRAASEWPVGSDEPERQLDNWMVHVDGKADRHIPLGAHQGAPRLRNDDCNSNASKVGAEWCNWKGVRLSDFLSKFGAPERVHRHVDTAGWRNGRWDAGQILCGPWNGPALLASANVAVLRNERCATHPKATARRCD